MNSALTPTTIAETLRPLAAADERIQAMWLFGSYASGHATPMSDVDIGVLLTSTLTFKEQLRLIDKLATALGVERLDVLDIGQADALLRHRILSP